MRRVLLALLIVTVILATIGFGAALADKGGQGNVNKNHHNCQAGDVNVIAVCLEKNHHIINVELDCVGAQVAALLGFNKCES